MTLSGAEHPAKLLEKRHFWPEGGAESGALADSDLRRVVEAWPELPDAIRRAVLALIAATSTR